MVEVLPKRIINDINDREAYASTYPTITSQNYEALHEIHIFLLPLNPDQATIDQAMEATEQFNKEKSRDYQLKMCFLTLVFRNLGEDGKKNEKNNTIW